MKRKMLSFIGTIAIAATTGCMAVSATDNSSGIKNRCEVVAVGNDVFIVDTRTGDVRKLDMTNAKPFKAPARESHRETEIEAGEAE